MYAREGAQLSPEESSYEDVDARTVQWLQAELAKRSKGKSRKSESSPEPSGMHPELIR